MTPESGTFLQRINYISNLLNSLFFNFFLSSFISLLVVYLVGGIIFNKYRKGATGKEMIPNVNFWTDFPLLVKVCKVNSHAVIDVRYFMKMPHHCSFTNRVTPFFDSFSRKRLLKLTKQRVTFDVHCKSSFSWLEEAVNEMNKHAVV